MGTSYNELSNNPSTAVTVLSTDVNNVFSSLVFGALHNILTTDVPSGRQNDLKKHEPSGKTFIFKLLTYGGAGRQIGSLLKNSYLNAVAVLVIRFWNTDVHGDLYKNKMEIYFKNVRPKLQSVLSHPSTLKRSIMSPFASCVTP